MRLLILSVVLLGLMSGCGAPEPTKNPTVQERPSKPTKGAESPTSASAI
jgi:hypothetical protein